MEATAGEGMEVEKGSGEGGKGGKAVAAELVGVVEDEDVGGGGDR